MTAGSIITIILVVLAIVSKGSVNMSERYGRASHLSIRSLTLLGIR